MNSILHMNTKPVLLALSLLNLIASTVNGQVIIQFRTSSYTVAESAGAVTLSVQLTGDTNTTVTVDYSTADGTATNGIKYTAASGTLAFEVGETNQAIMVPILDEGFVEGAKTFKVTLSNPTGGAVLG